MEKKIGEIFEYNGEWYQVVECSKDNYPCIGCCGCKRVGGARIFGGECNGNAREDRRFVIFKKLEKVGEQFLYKGKQMQSYIRATDELICNWNNNLLLLEHGDSDIIDIEIKQTKEDMEQEIEYFGDENAKCLNSESIEKNLKPFNLDAAKQGKPVCTRDGCKARILCFDRKDNTPIVALIERVDDIEILQCYHNDGKCFHYETSNNDLMMFPEKKEGWVNVYKGIDGVTLSQYPYTSKDEAIKESDILFGRIDTIKVSWEE